MDTKRRVTINIANNPLTIVTDEPEELVREITEELDGRFSSILRSNIRISPLDAALLCSLDYLGEKKKAESELERCRAELERYKGKLAEISAAAKVAVSEAGEAFASSAETEAVEVASESARSSGGRGSGTVSGNGKNSGNGKGSGSRASASEGASSADKAEAVATPEEKIRALEKYLENKKSSDRASAAADAKEREEKIRYIESLLRGGKKNDGGGK